MAEVAEIPDLRRAKDRERKKGGVSWVGDLAGKGGFSGVAGGAVAEAVVGAGSGGSGFLSFIESIFGEAMAALLPKALVATMAGCLVYGAYSAGLAFKSAGRALEAAAAKRAVFAQSREARTAYEGTERLPKADDFHSSLDLISGSLDGKTQAERDAEAAAAKATADKVAADQAKAAADAAKAAQAKAVPAVPVDPAALIATATTAATGVSPAAPAASRGFGAFSSQLGGAAGASGLHDFGFGHIMPGAGRLGGSTAMTSARVAIARTTSVLGRVHDPGLGKARRQLGAANQFASAALSTNNGQTSATNASQVFDTPRGVSGSITGQGATTGGPGTPSATTAPNSAGGSGGSGGGGGQSNPSLSQAGQAGDDCGALFPDGGYIRGGGGGCVCPPGMDGDGHKCSSVHHANVTPEQNLIMMALMLLALASVFIILAKMWAKRAKQDLLASLKPSPDSFALFTKAMGEYATARMFAMIAAALAGIVTLLGIMMIAMGGRSLVNGLLYTAMGGITLFLAIKAMMDDNMTDAKLQEIAQKAGQDPQAASALLEQYNQGLHR
ncbi:MAG: hypothetical protein HY077_07500 [Elusimicrobia bacterium]|nr:hypothetical protein [Elusimicrobiota bacterium]